MRTALQNFRSAQRRRHLEGQRAMPKSLYLQALETYHAQSWPDRYAARPYMAEGVAAYLRGLERDANPYEAGTLEAEAWSFGWLSEEASQGG
jgi:hypothetical protein